MRRIERELIAIEADRIEQLHESVEDTLNVGLKPVLALLDSAEDGRLIVEVADETPDHRVEALLKLAELELDFGRTEQQPAEHP